MEFSANQYFSTPSKSDAILKSNDGVHFYIQTFHLTINSTFFEDIFKKCTPDITHDGLPVACLDESSRIVELILSFCGRYSVSLELTVNDVVELTTALQKYCMENIEKAFTAFLTESPITEKEPIAIFALAGRYRWKDVYVAAARASLLHREEELYGHERNDPYLQDLSSVYLRRLLQYRQACHQAITNLDMQIRKIAREDGTRWTDHRGDYKDYFSKYCAGLKSRLASMPRETSVTEHEAMNQLLQGAYQYTSTRTYQDVLKLTVGLEKLIKDTVWKVEIQADF